MANPRAKRLRYTAEEAVDMVLGDDDWPSGSEDENLSDGNNDDEMSMPRPDNQNDFDSDTDSEAQNIDSSLVNEPTTSSTQKGPPQWSWEIKDLPRQESEVNSLVPLGPALQAKTLLEMFEVHFNKECVQHMVLETNRFRLQQKKTNVEPVTEEDIRCLIGICFYMSILPPPNRRMYWSAKTMQTHVADCMTVNRFEEILSILPANDNELEKKRGEPGFDRLHKVRPLLAMILENFKKCAEPEHCVSVDEQIIPFKGRHSLKVYNAKKPRKCGYKVWVQAGQSGYVHQFLFAGDTVSQLVTEENVGKSGELVIHLTKDQPPGSFVYFDNFFSSPERLVELKKKETICYLHDEGK